MENRIDLLITIALQSDEEDGDIGCVIVDVTCDAANWILAEQEKCELCHEGGALGDFIDAYGRLIGYKGAFFLEAKKAIKVREQENGGK